MAMKSSGINAPSEVGTSADLLQDMMKQQSPLTMSQHVHHQQQLSPLVHQHLNITPNSITTPIKEELAISPAHTTSLCNSMSDSSTVSVEEMMNDISPVADDPMLSAFDIQANIPSEPMDEATDLFAPHDY